MVWLILLLGILFGSSLSAAIISFLFSLQIPWTIWAVISFISLLGVVLSLFLAMRKGEDRSCDCERFEKEYKQILRGHLKVSILFWTFFYKKEKVKSFDDAKKEVFHDLRKELPSLKWLDSLLDEIRNDMAKYK